MKDADYKHRRLVAMSTTGKLSPIPPTPPSEVTQLPEAKASSTPRPRIAAHQPEVLPPPPSMLSSIKNTLKSLVGKKPSNS